MTAGRLAARRFVASEAYREAVDSGAFAAGSLPSAVRSVEVLSEAELRSALRLRTFSDLTSFDIEGVPIAGLLPARAVLPARCELIPVTKLQVLLGQELSETAYAGSAADGQPLPEAIENFGALNESPVKLPRFGTATPISLGVLDEPGVVESMIERRFDFGFTLGLENEILNDSTSGFWTGLLNLPTNSTGDSTHAIAYAKGGAYRADAITTAVGKVQDNGWYVRPLQVISSPDTRAATYTERDGNQRPLPVTEMLGDQVDQWLVSKFMPAGTAIVGDIFGAVGILQKGPLSVSLAPNHLDFLTRDLVEMALETRLFVWLRQPAALAIVSGL